MKPKKLLGTLSETSRLFILGKLRGNPKNLFKGIVPRIAAEFVPRTLPSKQPRISTQTRTFSDRAEASRGNPQPISFMLSGDCSRQPPSKKPRENLGTLPEKFRSASIAATSEHHRILDSLLATSLLENRGEPTRPFFGARYEEDSEDG